MLTRLTDPFEALLSLQETLDALSGGDWHGTGTSTRGVYPPVNIFQQGDDYIVVAEIPGLRKSDLQVQVQRRQLRLGGSKPSTYGEGLSVHRRERQGGSFDRAIDLPFEIDESGVKAEYRDGMLAVFLPRAKRDRARTVDIT